MGFVVFLAQIALWPHGHLPEMSKAICQSSELPTEFKQSVSDQLKSLVENTRNASAC